MLITKRERSKSNNKTTVKNNSNSTIYNNSEGCGNTIYKSASEYSAKVQRYNELRDKKLWCQGAWRDEDEEEMRGLRSWIRAHAEETEEY